MASLQEQVALVMQAKEQVISAINHTIQTQAKAAGAVTDLSGAYEGDAGYLGQAKAMLSKVEHDCGEMMNALERINELCNTWVAMQ